MAAVVQVEHALQVADPHVVGLEGEVDPPEMLLGDLEIAHGGGERPARIEAIVDPGAGGFETLDAPSLTARRGIVDLRGQAAAAGQVDVHPE